MQDTADSSYSTEPPVVTPRLQPVQESERIEALDVLRGFALLGIFMVNIQFFSLPFMEAVGHLTLGSAARGEVWGWAFIRTFCELKFISLFSLLFGMGLVVQVTRAKTKGRSFTMYYLRRTAILAIFGLAHGLLLWYGDILFLYACVSLLLFAMYRLNAKTLVKIWVGLVVFSIVIVTSLAGLQVIIEQRLPQPQPPAQVQSDMEIDPTDETVATEDQVETDQIDSPQPVIVDSESPRDDLLDALPSIDIDDEHPARGFAAIIEAGGDPTTGQWDVGERLAYKEGPFVDAFAFRLVSYAIALISGLVGYGWHVLAMFLLGAALIKLDFFAVERRHWHRRLFLIGVGIGLAAELSSTGIMLRFDFHPGWWGPVAVALHEFGSYTLCLGYVGGMTMLVNSGALRWLMHAMACVGRTALSNYIGQTVIATFLMYWWGLGWFGGVTRLQMIGLVLIIYTGQLVVSHVWLKFFRIGPLEWLWRSLTYLKPQQLLRKDGGTP